MNKLKLPVVILFLALQTAGAAAQTRRTPRRPATAQPPVTQPAVAAPAPSATPAPAPAAPVVLAVLNGQNISSTDIDPKVRQEFDALERRIAEARRQVLDIQINTMLLESEAAKRRISSQQLYDLEVAKKIGEPSAAEIEKFIDDNRNQIGESDPAKVREQVAAYLKGQREAKLSEELIARLRKTNPVVNVADPGVAGLAPATVIVTVGGRPITFGALSERLKPIVYKLRLNNYTLAKQALDVTINDLLLLAEATKRGVNPEDIIRKEVSDKVRPPTQAEVEKFYEENKARINGDFASVNNQIATYLQQKKRERLEEELSARLRQGANIRLLITEPALPTQLISVDDDPVRGDANAPVTIVEFTDFQCPSCAAMQPLLEEALKIYGNKVRLVVRDFPLAMHPNARKAAEAANAAHAQGKFFEYVSLLLKRQDQLDVPSLKKYATELGLNRAQFDAALDSGKYALEVKNDISDGELYGVDSTPAIFVNGVALREMSIEALRAAIDRGLASSAPKVSTKTN
jgi:protein-disulfide isomerase